MSSLAGARKDFDRLHAVLLRQDEIDWLEAWLDAGASSESQNASILAKLRALKTVLGQKIREPRSVPRFSADPNEGTSA